MGQGAQATGGFSRRAILLGGAASTVVVTGLPVLAAARAANPGKVLIQTPELRIAYDETLRSRVSLMSGGRAIDLTAFTPSEYVLDGQGVAIRDFALTGERREPATGARGPGVRTSISGRAANGLEKTVEVTVYERYPALASIRATYVNGGARTLNISRWINGDYRLDRPGARTGDPLFWAYQGASFADRRDWISPLRDGFAQQNNMGMNASDYGGGTPIVDLWDRDGGLAIGHLETTPQAVALPVSVTGAGARLRMEMEVAVALKPGERMTTLESFVGVHRGDAYATLKAYRQIMADGGLKAAQPPGGAYEAIWCAWGYGRNFTLDEVLAALPKVKAMGLKWVVLDDGWQKAEGDWVLDRKKFPGGDADMRAFTAAVKAAGLKPALWVAPLAVDPGSDALHDDPDMLLLDKDGAVQDITWWNSFYLCPAYPKTVEKTDALVRKIMQDWGFEGLKLDGQHLNGVAPCYNPAHNHATPHESAEKLQDFFKSVYDTALSLNPQAVVQYCPCGTSFAFHNTPYMNQSVASDPLTSWQVRSKGKALRGLTGDSAAYSGDHVELSDNADDFASSVGIGAVVATKFTWPGDHNPAEKNLLTPEREATWSRWINLYNDKMLSTGTYRGELYDIGFDRPEAHAVQKGDRLYYGFYAKRFDGAVELRGLEARAYRLTDYVHGRDLGVAHGPVARLTTTFEGSLLLEATPIA